MVDGIQKVAVIGSGVMGAGIAAHCANAGCEVLLLDIVPEGAEDLSLIHISEPTRHRLIAYAVFCFLIVFV